MCNYKYSYVDGYNKQVISNTTVWKELKTKNCHQTENTYRDNSFDILHIFLSSVSVYLGQKALRCKTSQITAVSPRLGYIPSRNSCDLKFEVLTNKELETDRKQ
jgi:hypothetical protein